MPPFALLLAYLRGRQRQQAVTVELKGRHSWLFVLLWALLRPSDELQIRAR